jgi:hypothetical protein
MAQKLNSSYVKNRYFDAGAANKALVQAYLGMIHNPDQINPASIRAMLETVSISCERIHDFMDTRGKEKAPINYAALEDSKKALMTVKEEVQQVLNTKGDIGSDQFHHTMEHYLLAAQQSIQVTARDIFGLVGYGALVATGAGAIPTAVAGASVLTGAAAGVGAGSAASSAAAMLTAAESLGVSASMGVGAAPAVAATGGGGIIPAIGAGISSTVSGLISQGALASPAVILLAPLLVVGAGAATVTGLVAAPFAPASIVASWGAAVGAVQQAKKIGVMRKFGERETSQALKENRELIASIGLESASEITRNLKILADQQEQQARKQSGTQGIVASTGHEEHKSMQQLLDPTPLIER